MTADIITMTPEQMLILDRMSDDLGYPFRDIASDTLVPERQCRQIIRGFHASGLAAYGPLFDQDGPGIRGKGYWLTRNGYEAQRFVRRIARAQLAHLFNHPDTSPFGQRRTV
jgi:hypothetical protein